MGRSMRGIWVCALVAAPALAAACGGDDSGAPGADAGGDAPDSTAEDSGGPDDTGVVDATASDTGIDSAPADDAGADVLDAGSDGADAEHTLDGAVCDGGAIAVTGVTPIFGWTGGSTPITIAGSGFIATPKVYVRSATQTLVPIVHSAFVSSKSITAIVPPIAAATYDIGVANPDGCAAYLPGALHIVPNPPPAIVSVSPAAGTTQSSTNVTVTGCHFPANVTLSTVDTTGNVVAQMATAATCTGPTTVCADGSALCTFQGTIGSTTLGVGVYLVRAGNSADQTYGDYASFVVTNPAQKLGNQYTASSALPAGAGRRSLALVAGRVDDANRFLYAVGGENASGAPLSSVVVAPLDKFGQVGAWFVQKNAMKTARSGLAVVRQGSYLYAMGGTSATDGTKGTSPSGAPLASIERAKILDPAQAPVVQDPPTASTAAGSLGAGTWYYKVSAVVNDADNPGGETLPSDEVVVTLSAAGQVTLDWAAVTGATSYRVYRSPAANGTSQSETLIASAVAGTTYTDTGASAGAEAPLAIGSTGVWVTQTTTLLHARSNAAAAVGPDGVGGLRVYVVGGWGACNGGGNAVMDCSESTSISALGDSVGPAFTVAGLLGTGGVDAGVDAGAGVLGARMRHGVALLSSPASADGGASTSFLVVGGGYGPGIGSGLVEYAPITNAAAALGSWQKANATFPDTRDGTQIAIVNGVAYAFMGGTAPNQYKGTGWLSSIGSVTSSSIDFGAWSSNAVALPNNAVLGRFGMAVESAYFYVVGGTSNDADALTTVYQILY